MIQIPKAPKRLTGVAWKKRREECFVRDGYICRSCKKQLKENYAAPHHIRTKKASGCDDLNNLVTLCHSCHDAVHKALIPNDFIN